LREKKLHREGISDIIPWLIKTKHHFSRNDRRSQKRIFGIGYENYELDLKDTFITKGEHSNNEKGFFGFPIYPDSHSHLYFHCWFLANWRGGSTFFY
jgi:hypothetical protein